MPKTTPVIEIVARLMRFYGMSFGDASNLTVNQANKLIAFSDVLKKNELLALLNIIAYPHTKKESQNKVMRWLKTYESRHLTPEESQEKLRQLLSKR